MKNISLLGACCNYGQTRYGPRVAPYYVETRLNKKITKIKEINNTNVFDYDLLYSVHNDELNNNKNIITIGGDHSISYSTINSALKKYKDSLHVIWIDAHTDINTQSTSVTHNLHGMPVGHLMGFEKHPLTTFDNEILHKSQITYIGIRDMDPPECERIKRYHINNYNSFYFTNSINITDYLKEKLQNKNIYISLDLDSLDPCVFPCTGTSVPNGLYLPEVLNIINTFKEKSVGMDIVEFDPLINNKYNKDCLNSIYKIIETYSN
jgi:arginase